MSKFKLNFGDIELKIPNIFLAINMVMELNYCVKNYLK